MYIDAISDQTEIEDLFKDVSPTSIWNGRQMKELDDNSSPAILRALKEHHGCNCSHISPNRIIKPMMTKADLSYSEKEGWKGQVSISVDLWKSEDKDSSPSKADDKVSSDDNSTGNTAAGDVDNHDQDKDS